MSHQHDSTAFEQQAALYLAGAMTPEERSEFERALPHAPQAQRDALAALRPAAEHLTAMIPQVEPDRSLRARVLERVERDAQRQQRHVWNAWSSSSQNSALYTLRAGEGEWQETGVEGIQVRQLFVDHAGNRMTAMFRMAPGTSYVPHVHDGPEECYVLQGDLHVGDELVMHAGDYQRASAGSVHGRQWTKGGCVLLITSSMTDIHLADDLGEAAPVR